MSDLYTMAILCGGLGTRLGDLTKNTPKCLVDVNDQWWLGYVLREVAQQGIERVVLCVGHLGARIEGYVGSGHWLGLDVQYSRDGDQQLGTAGALKNAAPLLGDDFFVLYGDSWPGVDLRAVQAAYEAEDCFGTMVVCEPPEGYRPNIWFEDGQIYQHDKRMLEADMRHIDYGLGILDHRALAVVDRTPYDLSDLYGYLAECGELTGYLSPERFYTIGTPASLAVTSEYLRSRVR